MSRCHDGHRREQRNPGSDRAYLGAYLSAVNPTNLPPQHSRPQQRRVGSLPTLLVQFPSAVVGVGHRRSHRFLSRRRSRPATVATRRISAIIKPSIVPRYFEHGRLLSTGPKVTSQLRTAPDCEGAGDPTRLNVQSAQPKPQAWRLVDRAEAGPARNVRKHQ
jgi:hypothetical protein